MLLPLKTVREIRCSCIYLYIDIVNRLVNLSTSCATLKQFSNSFIFFISIFFKMSHLWRQSHF